MEQLNGWGHGHATAQQRHQIARGIVHEAFDQVEPKIVQAIESFLATPISPNSFYAVELALLVLMRTLGRMILQATIQSLEPDDPQLLPRDLYHQCGGYRRRNEKTRNQRIATRFGNITLWRRGYRSWDRDEKTIYPLEMMLGLTECVSPALLSFLGQAISSAGMSQDATIALLREQCDVKIGVKRLRRCLEVFSEPMAELRQDCQVDALLEALRQADQSSGSRKPVLSVGRDGITLREYRHRSFEVATAATVSVYDRAGKRLKTIYLAWPPELGQATMDSMLTALLNELLSRWDGPLPRLAYVTDSGSNEVGYFEQVLRRMNHPSTGKRLDWLRVADFYHVSERIWAMAEALFNKNQQQQANAWARRMLKNLKKPSGASRVLHSAASLYHRRKLGKTRDADFWKAYRYLQSRTKHLRYSEYQSNHIPIGSGVTEAACKTIYTQRLKLSGMRWSFEGAKRILTLRTILLSGTWDATFESYLTRITPTQLRPYKAGSTEHLQNAA
jgi:hypothetical protein